MSRKQVSSAAPVDLNLVRIWLRVVELGSFTRAASELGLPTSSVSRAVTRLEAELGVDLLARTTRRLSLTPAGARYVAAARGAILTLDAAQSELSESEGEPRGVVRMTAPMPTGNRVEGLLARALVAFHERYPQVRVEMLLTGRRVDLLAENIDLALRGGKLSDDRLTARRLGRDRVILVAAPAYLKAHGTPKKLSELADHRCVLVNASDGTQRWVLSSNAGSAGVDVHGPVSVDEAPFAVGLAEAGLGIAMVPFTLAERALAAGSLARILSELEVRGMAMSLVYAKRAHEPRRVIALREFMYEFLKREYDLGAP